MTKHAMKRTQQRGIPADRVPLILAYGERSFDGHGGSRYLMTADAVSKLARAIGDLRQAERMRGEYVVVDADDPTQVITVSHRHY
jgi:hypothetical protein